ncbi:MAG: DUF3857 domain-containing protein [Ignavibacteriales bacterium]|nr:DUF3857 domain-containing protein [Ignavibacteriales bacterium]
MEKKNLNDDDIFKESINSGMARYKFTLPGLVPGCIIEYRYKITTTNLWRIKDWVFQTKEPVVWSEYLVRMPVNIAYTAVRKGFEPYEIVENNQVQQVFSGRAESELSGKIVTCNEFRWAVKNIPAIRNEPYMTARTDCLNAIDLQLSFYSFDGFSKKVLNTWEKVTEELRKDGQFYKALQPTSKIEALSAEITKGKLTQIEKIRAIQEWVASSIVFNGSERYYCTTDDPDDVLKEKKGNSADINFLLMALLRSAGIQCFPVLTSTRDNGKVQDFYPILAQFNYVLAQVKTEQGDIYMDGASNEMPYDILPTNLVSIKGLLINEQGFDWVVVPANKKSITKSTATVVITNDGGISGKIQDAYTDYAAIRVRRLFKNKKDDAVVKDAFDVDKYEYTLDSIVIAGKDSISGHLSLQALFSSSTYIQAAGDMMYINPSIAHRIVETPFKSEKRSFPIDFGYLSSRFTDFRFLIPEDYEVKEKPRTVSYYTEESGMLYTRKITVDGRNIRIEKKFEIKESELSPRLYESVKDFYARVIKAEAEIIVLAKKAPAVPAALPEKQETPPPAAKTPVIEANPSKKKTKK